MDSFGFGVLGDIFASGSGSAREEETASRPKASPRTEPVVDYTPPEIAAFQASTAQKTTKKYTGLSDALLPIKISQVLRCVSDENLKFVLYNNPVGSICLIGKATNIDKLASAIQFTLVDETGRIAVHYNYEGIFINDGDHVQVVGTVVLLTSENYYIDAQHVMILDLQKYNYEELLAYHKVSVAYAAYNLDLGAKLDLSKKHEGKIVHLPGHRQGSITVAELDSVELDAIYAHIVDPIERLIIKYLKKRQDTVAKRKELVACLSEQYVDSVIEEAINRLEQEAEIACTKDLVWPPI
uniref:Uncharacterized protein n=1 Tax=Babesia bovis TaxID=5865 RepID=S6AZE1_BABBO|nr:hypothetical protein [Babesia bovis]